MDRNELSERLLANTTRFLGHFDAPEEELGRSYGPGKWSAREILCHLADVELANLWRFLKAVTEDGSSVECFDENAWAKILDYPSRPISISRDLFVGARGLLQHSVETLADSALSSKCHHPEKGTLTGWRWLQLILDHADHHLGQVEAARSGTEWKPDLNEESWMYGATS